jgi:AbrB family looped-hinge helix DNA binding protein
MEDDLPGTRIAERLLTRPEGATMRELIAATGGPQYNLLKRLESIGGTVRKKREGRETRYNVVMPKPVYEMSVNDKGQVTLPKGLREEMRVFAGQTLSAEVHDGKVVLAPKVTSIRDLFGILGKPPNGKHATIEEMNEAIRQHAVDRYLRATGRRK